MPRAKRLTKQQVATMQRLIADHPELTNAQIAELVGTTGGTVGAERRGVRNPIEMAKKAAFEVARRELGLVPPMAKVEEPSATFLAVDSGLAYRAPEPTTQQKIRDLTAEIRLQALKRLRQQLTEGQLSPDDVLAALGDQP